MLQWELSCLFSSSRSEKSGQEVIQYQERLWASLSSSPRVCALGVVGPALLFRAAEEVGGVSS